jgi:hypothetical protein
VSGSAAARWIDALLTAEGQALLAQLASAPPAAGSEIALITRLRRTHSPELVSAAVEQAALRVRAAAKFSNAAHMYFTRAGLEQASSDRMATHHARRFAAFDRMADLCTGIGGDLAGLAAARTVIAVDAEPVHARLARLNAEVNGVGPNVTVICADVRDVRLDSLAAAFVDPARRSTERRFSTGAGEPPLSWCFALAERVRALGIKAAPALAVDLVPSGWELEFVSEHRELKECALWSPVLATARRRATVLPDAVTLTERRGASSPVREPGRYLIDPDPAVTRAGLVAEFGESLGDCWRIDERVGFLSANDPVQSPFGRTLAVAASVPWNLAAVKTLLRDLDVGIVDIRKRGSAVDVDALQRRLKLSGSRSATLVLTRVADRPWAFVCFPPDLT